VLAEGVRRSAGRLGEVERLTAAVRSFSMLSAEERAALVDLYEERFKEKGEDVSTVGWKTREEQALRFRILCEVGDLRNATVCDVGCGFGDLLDYLAGTVSADRYTGLEIAPSLLARARTKHPGATFACVDLLQDEYSRQSDYFLLSGALTYKVRDNMAVAARMMERMFALCRKGTALNFLTSDVNYQLDRNYHYDPEAMLGLARNLTRWVKLRHDYPLWEFTLYLYKEAQG
jgi:SAM-dependent methyltransferase